MSEVNVRKWHKIIISSHFSSNTSNADQLFNFDSI